MSSNVSDQNPVEQVAEVVQVAPTVQELSLVAVENECAVTTSLRVAEVFGKQHKNVLRDIQNLECSDDFRKLNFEPSHIIKQLPNNGSKKLPMYYITRDGFMFLVMGFTGKTAAKWKEAYIKAFNEMEAKIRAEQMAKAIEEHDRKEAEEYDRLLKREDREEAEVDRRVEELARQRNEEAKAKAEAQARANDQGNGEAVRIDTTRCGWSVLSSKEIARLTGRPHSDVMKSMQRCAKYCKRSGRVFIRAERWEADKYGCHSMMWSTYNGVKLMHKYGRTAITDDEMAIISHAFRYHTRHLPPSLPVVVRHSQTPRKATKAQTKPTDTPPTQAQAPEQQPTTKAAQTTAQPIATMPQTPTDLMQRFVKAVGVMMGMDTDNLMNLMNKGE
jgi:Rha family phage regulatory protein